MKTPVAACLFIALLLLLSAPSLASPPDCGLWGLTGSSSAGRSHVYSLADDASSWTRMNNVRQVRLAGVAVVGDTAYIIGGTNNGARRPLTQRYNLETETLSDGSPLPKALHGLSCDNVGRKVYCLGDHTGELYVYDTEDDAWEVVDNGLTPVVSFPALVREHGGTLLAIGGETVAGDENSGISAVSRYNPATNSWTTAPSLNLRRFAVDAVRLPDGRIVVLGGEKDIADTTMEILSVGSATWSSYVLPSSWVERNFQGLVAASNTLIYSVAGITGASSSNLVQRLNISSLFSIEVDTVANYPYAQAEVCVVYYCPAEAVVTTSMTSTTSSPTTIFVTTTTTVPPSNEIDMTVPFVYYLGNVEPLPAKANGFPLFKDYWKVKDIATIENDREEVSQWLPDREQSFNLFNDGLSFAPKKNYAISGIYSVLGGCPKNQLAKSGRYICHSTVPRFAFRSRRTGILSNYWTGPLIERSSSEAHPQLDCGDGNALAFLGFAAPDGEGRRAISAHCRAILNLIEPSDYQMDCAWRDFVSYGDISDVDRFPGLALEAPAGTYVRAIEADVIGVAGYYPVAHPGIKDVTSSWTFSPVTDSNQQLRTRIDMWKNYGRYRLLVCPLTVCEPGTEKTNATTCRDCSSGNFNDGNTIGCEACLVGKYQPLARQASCLDAAEGYFVDSPEAVSQTPCPRGTFSTGGAASCTGCSRGTSPEDGERGTYQPNTTKNMCLECPKGTIAVSDSAIECTAMEPLNVSYSITASSIRLSLPIDALIGSGSRIELFRLNISELNGQEFSSSTPTIKILNASLDTYTIDSLQPGTEYRLRVEAKANGADMYDVVSSFSLSFTTYCSCVGNYTDGRPDHFHLTQAWGEMSFTWLDASLCADTFLIKRRYPGEDHYTILDRKIGRAGDVCGQILSPAGLSDTLLASAAPGSTVEYCAAAVGKVEAATCTNHTVQWEAGVHGTVSLAQSAGGFAISNATVHYEVDGVLRSMPAEETGDFEVRIADAASTQSGLRQTLRLWVSVPSDGDTRNLTCVGRFCSGVAAELTLRHLSFHNLEFVDEHVTPIAGKVSVGFVPPGNSPSPSLPVEDTGCPVFNATVCLYSGRQRNLGALLGCGATAHDGTYTVAVPLYSKFYAVVELDGHDFAEAPFGAGVLQPDAETVQKPGVVGEGGLVDVYSVGEGVTDSLNFLDITTRRLRVEVAGGTDRCNVPLRAVGEETPVRLGMQGCSWSTDIDLPLAGGYHATIMAPAQRVMLELLPSATLGDDDIVASDIRNYLRSVRQLNRAVNLLETTKTVRFEFHSAPLISAKVATPFSENELSPLSSVTVAMLQDLTVEFEVKEKYGDDTCNDVQGNLTVYNRLGEDLKSTAGARAKTLLPTSYKKLSACRSGCEFALEPLKTDLASTGTPNATSASQSSTSATNSTATIATTTTATDGFSSSTSTTAPTPEDQEIERKVDAPLVELALKTGFTNEIGSCGSSVSAVGLEELYKDMTVAVSTEYGTSTSELYHFIVIGDRELGALDAKIAVPQYNPLLVIRDPPGDSSFATFEAEQIDIAITSHNYDTRSELRHLASISSGSQQEVSACVLPAPAGAGSCNEMAKVMANGGLGRESTIALKHSHHAEKTHHMGISISASTSDKWAGEDLYLVPTFDVQLFSTQDIEEDGSGGYTCVHTTSWDYADSSEPLFSFKSIGDVKKELADAQAIISSEQQEQADCDGDDSCEQAAQEKINNAKVVRDRWKAIINDTANLETCVVGSPGCDISPYSGMLPDAVTQDARAADGANPDKLSTYNGVSFSGGGQKVTLSLTAEDETRKEEGSEDDTARSIRTSVKRSISVASVSVGSLMETESKPSFSIAVSKASATDKSSTFSLTLADKNKGDYFAFQLFRDHKYGGFVYRNISGSSRCPHESGTSPREAVTVTLTPPLPPHNVVPVGEPFVVQVEISTSGAELGLEANYVLYAKAAPGVRLSLSGNTFTGDRTYYALTSGTKLYERLLVYADDVDAPSLLTTDGTFDFPIVVDAASQCEHVMGLPSPYVLSRQDVTASFVPRCARVAWSHDQELLGVEIFNLESQEQGQPDVVTLQALNPDFALHSWSTHPRLQAVRLRFRKKGDIEWQFAADSNGVLNLASATESAFGVSFVSWDVTGLNDGLYEVSLISECGGDSEDVSDTIQVLIDRQAPAAFHAVVNSELDATQVASVEFNDDLDCTLPLAISASVAVNNGTAQVYEGDVAQSQPFDVSCSGRSVRLSFLRLNVAAGDVLAIELTRVVDKAGNVLDSGDALAWTMTQPAARRRRQADSEAVGERVGHNDAVGTAQPATTPSPHGRQATWAPSSLVAAVMAVVAFQTVLGMMAVAAMLRRTATAAAKEATAAIRFGSMAVAP